MSLVGGPAQGRAWPNRPGTGITRPVQTTRTVDAEAGFRPERAARWLRKLSLPLFALGVLALFWVLELTRIPAGMDSMVDIPPGSTVLLDRRAGSVRAGMAVMVDLPQGGTLLTRLVRCEPDGGLWVENDHRASALPDSRSFGALPAACLRGSVLVVFPPDVPAEVPR